MPPETRLAVAVEAPPPRYWGAAPLTVREVALRSWPEAPVPVLALLDGGETTLDALVGASTDQLVRLFLLLDDLWRERALTLLDDLDRPSLSVVPTTHDVPLNLGHGVAAGTWRLSRFAYLRRSEEGDLRMENPTRPARVTVLEPAIASALASLAAPMTLEGLAAVLPSSLPISPETLLTLLSIAGAIERCDDSGTGPEERSEVLQQWEFHDLLFHTRSRMGRHSEPMGGLFRFKDILPPPEVTKPDPWLDRAIALPRPDLARVAAADPPLTQVLEVRRSIREQDFQRPITLAQIGEFLYRSARIRGTFPTSIGEFTTRPYPGGGAAYELEIYLTVNVCEDLARGLYYYDPGAHALALVHPPDAEVEGLLDDAWLSAARQCRPQVLITLCSRFQRLSWKYSGMAYATSLKNVGVLVQTFYLVATAMGLAGCALGLGNADRMARLTGTDFFVESSVGEFMLGTSLVTA
jgi:SagB-type dehydrogenase family enzyme